MLDIYFDFSSLTLTADLANIVVPLYKSALYKLFMSVPESALHLLVFLGMHSSCSTGGNGCSRRHGGY